MNQNALLTALAEVGVHPVESVTDIHGTEYALGRVSARCQLRVYRIVAETIEHIGGEDVAGQNVAGVITGLAMADEKVADALDRVFATAWPDVAEAMGTPTEVLDIETLVGAILPFSAGPLARVIRAMGAEE